MILYQTTFSDSTEGMGVKAPKGKWVLSYGICDDGPVKPQTYNSETEARAAFTKAKRGYAQLGQRIWFAYLFDEHGRRTDLA